MQYIISELLNIPRGNSNMFQDNIKLVTIKPLINKLQYYYKMIDEEEQHKKANIISELTNLPIDIVRVHIISKL